MLLLWNNSKKIDDTNSNAEPDADINELYIDHIVGSSVIIKNNEITLEATKREYRPFLRSVTAFGWTKMGTQIFDRSTFLWEKVPGDKICFFPMGTGIHQVVLLFTKL